ANDLDEAVYHPEPRPDQQAEAAWRRSDEVVAALRSSEGWLTRWRRTLDPRPLMRKDHPLPEPVTVASTDATTGASTGASTDASTDDAGDVSAVVPPGPPDQEGDVHA